MSTISEEPATSSTKESVSVAVKKLYKVIQHRTGAVGGYGHNGPVYGEITMGSFQKVIDFLKFNSRFDHKSIFLDIGAGLGKPSLHVLADPGVKASFGVELEDLRWKLSLHNLRHVLEDVEELRTLAEKPNCFFALGDIMHAETFEPFTHLYTFDVGFPSAVFRSMAKAFNVSTSALVFISFHKPKEIIRDYGFNADLCGAVTTRMHGSNESHKCYVYRHLGNYRRLYPEDLVRFPAVVVNLYPTNRQTRLSDFMTQKKTQPDPVEAKDKDKKAKHQEEDEAKGPKKQEAKLVDIVAVDEDDIGSKVPLEEEVVVVMAAPGTPKGRTRTPVRQSTRNKRKREAEAVSAKIETRHAGGASEEARAEAPATASALEEDQEEPASARRSLFCGNKKASEGDKVVEGGVGGVGSIAWKKPQVARIFADGFRTLTAHQEGSYCDHLRAQVEDTLLCNVRPSRRQKLDVDRI